MFTPRSCVAGDAVLRQQLGLPALKECIADAAEKAAAVAAAGGGGTNAPDEALAAVR
jgi:hypothetical protein